MRRSRCCAPPNDQIQPAAKPMVCNARLDAGAVFCPPPNATRAQRRSLDATDTIAHCAGRTSATAISGFDFCVAPGLLRPAWAVAAGVFASAANENAVRIDVLVREGPHTIISWPNRQGTHLAPRTQQVIRTYALILPPHSTRTRDPQETGAPSWH